MDLSRSRSTKSPLLRSAGLTVLSAGLVVLYWWLKDFRLRLIGDAAPSIRACDAVFAETYPLKLAFQIPYCLVLDIAGVRTWLVLQIVLWSLAVVLIYRTGAGLFDEYTGIIAAVTLAFTFETFRFALRPQSDLMLLFAVAVCLWALSQYERDSTRSTRLLVVGSLLFVAFAKQLGFPLVFAWVVWIVFASKGDTSLDLRNPSLLHLGLYATLGVLTVFVIATYFIPRFTGSAPEAGIYWRSGFAGAWWNGIIATHPSTPTFEYIYQPRSAASMASWMVVNADHILVMGFMRAAFFFIPVLPRWDLFHIVVNLVTIFPLGVGTFLGARRLLSDGRHRIAGLLLAPILASLLTVALVYVDGGFNYRAPATLAFALLTAYWIRNAAAESKLAIRVRERLSTVVTIRNID